MDVDGDATTDALPGRGDPPREHRRHVGWVIGAVAAAIVVALVALGVLFVRELAVRGRPTPEFPSLVENPDTTLHGSVAFISEAKNPEVKERRACARVSLASGAAAKDVYCWTISDSALATAVWRDDRRLLVTAFEAPVGDQPAAPVWGKVVDVATGTTEDVPEGQLGQGARPSSQPVENPDGERVSMKSGDGEATITVSGPSGSRTLLAIDRANPDWSLQSGPVWSPDSAWVMTWDGRLLVTTDGPAPTTRVLAGEASWSPYGSEVPNFSIIADDVDFG